MVVCHGLISPLLTVSLFEAIIVVHPGLGPLVRA